MRRGPTVDHQNNIFVENQMGGCVRNADDITPWIHYNLREPEQRCPVREHCGCPSNPHPDPLDIDDPDEYLGSNVEAVPFATMPKNRPRTLREHFGAPARHTVPRSGRGRHVHGAMPLE